MVSQDVLLKNESNEQAHPNQDLGIWTPRQLASKLNTSTRTLDRWNLLRCGPPRITINRKIFYRIAAVEAWLQSREQRPCSKLVRGRR
jgi:hypothetical protein